jgi:hypothetical protein
VGAVPPPRPPRVVTTGKEGAARGAGRPRCWRATVPRWAPRARAARCCCAWWVCCCAVTAIYLCHACSCSPAMLQVRCAAEIPPCLPASGPPAGRSDTSSSSGTRDVLTLTTTGSTCLESPACLCRTLDGVWQTVARSALEPVRRRTAVWQELARLRARWGGSAAAGGGHPAHAARPHGAALARAPSGGCSDHLALRVVQAAEAAAGAPAVAATWSS